jgi:hypothetical protein
MVTYFSEGFADALANGLGTAVSALVAVITLLYVVLK